MENTTDFRRFGALCRSCRYEFVVRNGKGGRFFRSVRLSSCKRLKVPAHRAERVHTTVRAYAVTVLCKLPKSFEKFRKLCACSRYTHTHTHTYLCTHAHFGKTKMLITKISIDRNDNNIVSRWRRVACCKRACTWRGCFVRDDDGLYTGWGSGYRRFEEKPQLKFVRTHWPTLCGSGTGYRDRCAVHRKIRGSEGLWPDSEKLFFISGGGGGGVCLIFFHGYFFFSKQLRFEPL